MTETKIYIGAQHFQNMEKDVRGETVIIENERFYRISNYDLMRPFLMNIVSDSDLWMFISSNGALTAGRKNPDNALFPYYTDDRIHDSHDITGSKTVIFVKRENKSFLWKPFFAGHNGIYNVDRNLYKNVAGNTIIFEEVNHDLKLTFKYAWQNCDKFGFVKKPTIINNGNETVNVELLDGIQNILPFGADRKFQLEYSTLLDAYKKNELIEKTGLGLFTLSSIPTDKAEPSEALKASTVWSVGLSNKKILLSSLQVEAFENGQPVAQKKITKAQRGAYFVNSTLELSPGNTLTWYIVADVNKDQADVSTLNYLLNSKHDEITELIEKEISKSKKNLNSIVASADGIQLTKDQLIISRHFSNTVFNVMRGGIFDDNYFISKPDIISFINKADKLLSDNRIDFFNNLPDQISFVELMECARNAKDPVLEMMCYEYMPLTFGRRHGDPSRPWNLFSIDIKDEHGDKALNYQGNWRDIFQNWEALALSFPGFIENMIVKFANASTADGYNPYKVTRDGFDWEELDPSDSWSYIGYWGDHQVAYLHKLLLLSDKFNPGTLKEFLVKEIFTYANVPYKIKSYEEIIKDPHNTIDFDFELNGKIKERVSEKGNIGKYIFDNDGKLFRVNFTEKLLLVILTKLSNFIPEAGIWMNTQRPEWNDANNALVGNGASMVTLYYLRSFVSLCINLFSGIESEHVKLSEEVVELLDSISNILTELRELSKDSISDYERKIILDKLGTAGSDYRNKIYSDNFSGMKKPFTFSKIHMFLHLALDNIDHSIYANKRDDNLYHSYNLIKINNSNGISIRHLYEMLEGQVAILNSGFLSAEDSVQLLNSLKKSVLYRKDQNSYLLYPERELPLFTEKNIIPSELIEASAFLKKMIREKNSSIVVEDVDGKVHFNSKFKNKSYLKEALEKNVKSLSNNENEEQIVLDIYESVFDHQSFTGRSGTFYKYEGLGSIYWHMVSKLLLAVQDTFYRVLDSDENVNALIELKKIYYEIREGIGIHKSPKLYGAFPTDPYSHTPSNMGAQQPGMTGQVKEDIITRFGELGVLVRDGKIHFNTSLLDKNEFLEKSCIYEYYNVTGEQQTLMLNPGMIAFTICQVPVIYILAEEEKIIVTFDNNNEVELEGFVLGAGMSKMIFNRENKVVKVKVLVNK